VTAGVEIGAMECQRCGSPFHVQSILVDVIKNLHPLVIRQILQHGYNSLTPHPYNLIAIEQTQRIQCKL
jgi:hypothetical protein